MVNDKEVLQAVEKAYQLWNNNGLPNQEEFIQNAMFNDILKIVKNIFNKPFTGSQSIKDKHFSSVLYPTILGFFELTAEVMIYGKFKGYIIPKKDFNLKEVENKLDSDGFRLRGSNLSFEGFIKDLPNGIQENQIDQALILEIDNSHSRYFKPLQETLRPFYVQYFNIYTNLNYALSIANTPQIRLNKMREMLSNNDGGIAEVKEKIGFLKQAMRDIKNALRAGGNGEKVIFQDAGDSIVFEMPNMDSYLKADEYLQSKIANAIDAPIAFLFGQAPQGMNATGEKDTLQWNNLSQFWCNRITIPVMREIEKLFSLEPSNFDFTDYNAAYSKVENVSKSSMFLNNAQQNQTLEQEKLQNTLRGYLS